MVLDTKEMSGKRTKLLRKVFIVLNPQARFDRHAWRTFKRDYTRTSKAERKTIMDQ